MMEFNDIWAAIITLAVKQARLITDDQEALEVKSLYKQWDKQIGQQLAVGEYLQHNGKLFRVLTAHTAQTNWEPGVGTESIYVVVDKEHAGTLEDPIPYPGNMELFNGRYYIEDDIVYLCTRDSGIALNNKLNELVGLYVEVTSGVSEEEPEGTKEDPIPYEQGMELIVDKHYIQNNVIYLCILNSGAPLYHDLSNLVGLYVQVANI